MATSSDILSPSLHQTSKSMDNGQLPQPSEQAPASASGLIDLPEPVHVGSPGSSPPIDSVALDEISADVSLTPIRLSTTSNSASAQAACAAPSEHAIDSALQ
eukprot:236969-Pleurochrysis_carterae.AAC.1